MKGNVLPVTVLAGFLGTGKTTLLNRALRESRGVRYGVLVNDFGAVNIDAKLVNSIERDAISLSNGCVCCSMRGGLVASVGRLLERQNPPERLLVEASGIADPHGVIAAFRTASLRDRTRIHGVVTLVDAENARNPLLDQQLFEEQLRAADLVILNKTDLVTREDVECVQDWIRSLVPAVRIIPTVGANVPLEVVLGSPGDGRPGSEEAHHAHNTSGFESWHHGTERPLAYRRVRALLDGLPVGVFRAKGVLFLADAPDLRFVAQMVGKRASIEVEGRWNGEERKTDFVCIGEPGAISAEWLAQKIEACATEAVPLLSNEGLRRARAALRLPPATRESVAVRAPDADGGSR